MDDKQKARDFLAPFLTDQDRQQLEDFDNQFAALEKKLDAIEEGMKKAALERDNKLFVELKSRGQQLIEQQHDIANRQGELRRAVENKYIESFNGDVEAILNDLQAIVNTIEKEDYISWQSRRKRDLAPLLENKPPEGSSPERLEAYDRTKALSVESYANCYFYVSSFVRVQLNALLTDGITEDVADKAIAIIKDKALSFYPEAPLQISKEELLKITAAAPDVIDYPLDKVNDDLWSAFAEGKDNDGQLQLFVDTANKAQKKQGNKAIVLLAIDFSALGDAVSITKKLTHYDKLVYIAAAAVFNNSPDNIGTVSQIYHAMGYTGRPSQSDFKKIMDSLTKMGTARIYIDNKPEIKINKGYPTFTYDGPLLPFERITISVNNNITDAAIHYFREPPLLNFARGRQQITTISRLLLESPISKTEANLAIQDYLLEEIAHMKNNKKFSRKMLFETIYTNCNIKTAKQKTRAPEKIKRYLNHYKDRGWIEGFKETEDGITILL